MDAGKKLAAKAPVLGTSQYDSTRSRALLQGIGLQLPGWCPLSLLVRWITYAKNPMGMGTYSREGHETPLTDSRFSDAKNALWTALTRGLLEAEGRFSVLSPSHAKASDYSKLVLPYNGDVWRKLFTEHESKFEKDTGTVLLTRSRTRIPPKAWHAEGYDWDEGVLRSNGWAKFPAHFRGVSVNIATLIRRDEPPAQTLPVSVASSAGRKAKYNWEAFYVEIVSRANHLDGLPESQAELVRDMSLWSQYEWGEEPSESLIKEKISPIYKRKRQL
ncbi:MAG: hypothetical protein JO230_19895 [Xanthobacteraceae bacterium]|nr:hypothetical protein [Xanthobacteraceae bacterium]